PDPENEYQILVAQFLHVAGEPVAARQYAATRMAMVQKHLDEYPHNLNLRVELVRLLALSGDRSGMQREEHRLLREFPINGFVLRGLAGAHAFLGDGARGVELLRQAVKDGFYGSMATTDRLIPEINRAPDYRILVGELETARARLIRDYGPV